MTLDLQPVKAYYESLGLNCRIREPKYEWGDTKITVTDGPNFVLSTHIDMTGIEYTVTQEGDEVFVWEIVVKKDARGKGLANKLLKPIFELHPEVVTLRDESRGFWEHIQEQHPEIEWRVELEESMSQEQYARYFPEGWDPTKRDAGVWPERGTDGWLCANNPDDYDSALWAAAGEWATQKWGKEIAEDVAEAISNAWWAGYMKGWDNGKTV
jgi:hypothetical protein